MALDWPPKDPDEVLDFVVDWSRRLDGDTIQASTFIVPTGLVLDSSSYQPTTATAWLSGGTLGSSYDIVNRVETAGGRTFDQTVRLRMRAK